MEKSQAALVGAVGGRGVGAHLGHGQQGGIGTTCMPFPLRWLSAATRGSPRKAAKGWGRDEVFPSLEHAGRGPLEAWNAHHVEKVSAAVLSSQDLGCWLWATWKPDVFCVE